MEHAKLWEGMKNKHYLWALLPVGAVAVIQYISTMLAMVSMANDIGVIVGLIMACALVLACLFAINKLIKHLNNLKNKK